MMLDPLTRQIYDKAKELEPHIYEMLCRFDAELAALHHAGMVIQKSRIGLLEQIIRSSPEIAKAAAFSDTSSSR